jgi:hypothetical protein
MAKAVEYRFAGLKCDAAGCDYRDDAIRMDQYESYLNAPCPKCGASLLTPEDLLALKLIIAGMDWVNATSGPVAEDAERVLVRIKMDGSGVPEIVEGEK